MSNATPRPSRRTVFFTALIANLEPRASVETDAHRREQLVEAARFYRLNEESRGGR